MTVSIEMHNDVAVIGDAKLALAQLLAAVTAPVGAQSYFPGYHLDWERRSPGRRGVMFRALSNVRPSHLAHAGLFAFAGHLWPVWLGFRGDPA